MKSRVAVLLVLVLTAVSLGLPEQTASATRSWHRVLLSRDGHHWKSDLTLPLFPRNLALAPGTEQVRRFYVRNQSGGAASLRVTVQVTGSSGILARPAFRMGVRTNGRLYQRVRSTGSHEVAHLRVAKGKIVPVDVRVRLLRRAGNKTMDGWLRFVTQVRLIRKG